MPLPMSPPDLSGAVRAARDGDRAAFEEIYRACVGRVYALSLRLCAGNEGEAQEVTQDTFVQAWRQLRSFRGDARLTSWLHRLTVNEFYQRRRAERRRHDRVAPTAEPPDVMRPGAPDPAARMDLDTAVRALPAGAREVFVLYEIEGYTHKEIGRMVGIAVGTSKAHLHRARRLLREALDR